MASLSLTTPPEERTPQPTAPREAEPKQDLLLVADFGDPVAADYVAHVCRQGARNVAVVTDAAFRSPIDAPVRFYPREGFSGAGLQTAGENNRIGALVLFLKPRWTEKDRRVLDELITLLGEGRDGFVCIVSTFRVHFGDREAAEAEAFVKERAERPGVRTVVFRPGHVLSENARTSAWLRRLGFCYPLVPARLRSCCVKGDELFAAIESERQTGHSYRSRTYTLLGPNQPWRDLLARHRSKGLWQSCLTVASAILSLLLVGRLAGLILNFLARRNPALRRWNFDTLWPRSFRELLGLYNKYNYRHLKVVGYNNGVIHFGQKFPGKTVVSTTYLNRVLRTKDDTIKADSGATIRKARDFLAGSNQDLFVVPNYSYVCLGTSFFVPIHGSASDYSCVAETITKVVLYDPVKDRLIVTTRDEPAFRDYVYNMGVDVLLLRLYLRVKPKSRYYVQRQERENPTAAELLDVFQDPRASNVEVRKSSAASSKVQVNKYYNDAEGAESPVLELPRDSLGRLWDRLEENAVTSFLMHALTRYFAWHVELFFTAEEFATFWQTHGAVPLRKIQLRYIRRDGFPHSPFRDQDCISSDMFMLRRSRRAFEAYLKQTFAVVRANPGKHSR